MEIDENKRDALGSAVKGARAAKKPAGDFELEDYWDDGSPLKDRESLPVCVTLNLVRFTDIFHINLIDSEDSLAPSRTFS